MRYIVVGCGLSGSVVARHLADTGREVEIWERRRHIGGNMFDHREEHGFLVQDYGPHTFHTNDPDLMAYMERFQDWDPYILRCGAEWDGCYTPTPFNFTTIDTFFPPEEAAELRERIAEVYPGRGTVTVVEALSSDDPSIRRYAEYLFEKDYRPYTSKQWGIPPSEIDPSVLKRVPLRMSYEDRYFDDEFQVMPRVSFADFFERLLEHPNIRVELGTEALDRIRVTADGLTVDGADDPFVIYTGALDELFGYRFGRLPYRSLRFETLFSDEDSHQPAPVVAHPQHPEIVRTTEYKKLPAQDLPGTVYVEERSLRHDPDLGTEPYYPVLTEDSRAMYARYRACADSIPNMRCCGRLADFRYYNMDQALARALETASSLRRHLESRAFLASMTSL